MVEVAVEEVVIVYVVEVAVLVEEVGMVEVGERGVLEVLFVAAKLKFAFERDVTDGTKGCEAAGERNRAFDRLVCAPVVDGFDAFDLP